MKYTLNQLTLFYLFFKNTSLLNSPLKLENYSDPIELYKKGHKIHIKKLNRGKFTEYCGGNVTDACILKGKNSPDPKIRKRATFAANARTWKHLLGGVLKVVKLLPRKLKFPKSSSIFDSPEYRQLELLRIAEKADSGRHAVKEWLRSPHFGERASRHMTRELGYNLGKFESSLLSRHDPPKGFKPVDTILEINKNGAAGISSINKVNKGADRIIKIDPNNSVEPRYTGAHEAAHMSTLNYTPTNGWKLTRVLFDEDLRPLLDILMKNALQLADLLEIDPKKYARTIEKLSERRGISTLEAKTIIDNWIPYLKRDLEARARGIASVIYSRTNHTKKIPVEVDGGLGVFTDLSLDNLYKNIFTIGTPIGVGLYAAQN